LARRGRGPAAVLVGPLRGLCRGAVVDGDLVPGACKVAGHRVAHDAQAKEGDLVRGDRFVTALAHRVRLLSNGEFEGSRVNSRAAARGRGNRWHASRSPGRG